MRWIGDRRVERLGTAGVRVGGWGAAPGILAAIAVVVAVGGAGCRKDARLAGREVPHVTVRTVTDGDVVLDRSASPKRVAHALLKVIRDDVRATSAQAHEEALRRQLDLCAPDSIFARYEDLHRRNRPGYKADRDETVYGAVQSWAPTFAHYVDSFDFEWPEAERAMVLRDGRKLAEDASAEKHVLVEVADPGGAENAAAVAQVTLVNESGYWRVLNVGFVAGQRHLAVRTPAQTSAPAAAAGAD